MLNNISPDYRVVFDKYSHTDAVVRITAPTKEEVVSIRTLIYVGLSYYNAKVAFSWEAEQGFTDGNEYIFDKTKQTLPIGLIPRARDYLKERKPNLKIEVAPAIREIYSNPNGIISRDSIREFADKCNIYNYRDDFKITPYEHQIKLVERALNGRRISLMACTSAGKSLSMYLMSRYLMEVEKKKVLVITPSSSLVVQLYSDYTKDYGWKEADDYMTLIYGESKDKLTAKQKKQLDALNLGEEVMLKDIVVSTWQSLQPKLKDHCPPCDKKRRHLRPEQCDDCDTLRKKSKDFFGAFSAVIVDEAHSTRGVVLRSILDACYNATDFKIGLSGTLPDEGLDAAWIEGALGRKEEIVRLKELVALGILTPAEVHAIKVPYDEEVRPFINRQPFQTEYSLLTNNGSRKKVMDLLIKSNKITTKENTIVLFKNKGTLTEMYDYLKEKYPEFKYRIIKGEISTKEREAIRNELEQDTGYMVIATYGTMKQGVNIKLLHNLVFAEFSKSMYEIVQSIGRIVRPHKDKTLARVFDIYDDAHYYTKPRGGGYPKLKENYSLKHHAVRRQYFDKDDIPIIDISLEGVYEASVNPEEVEAKKATAKKKAAEKTAKKPPKKGKGKDSKFLGKKLP